jgi:hypothetical protein
MRQDWGSEEGDRSGEHGRERYPDMVARLARERVTGRGLYDKHGDFERVKARCEYLYFVRPPLPTPPVSTAPAPVVPPAASSRPAACRRPASSSAARPSTYFCSPSTRSRPGARARGACASRSCSPPPRSSAAPVAKEGLRRCMQVGLEHQCSLAGWPRRRASRAGARGGALSGGNAHGRADPGCALAVLAADPRG